jgi:hypothetical protein
MPPEAGWSQKSAVGAHAVYAAWYKLTVHEYEGCSDTGGTCGECSLDAKINATRLPSMTDICVCQQWLDILSDSHIHVSSSFDFPPSLSHRKEEYIFLSVTQCSVI